MDVIIVGAGGHGKVVLDILRAGGEHRVVGFLDANSDLHGMEISRCPVLGDLNMVGKLKGKGVAGAVVAIGDNRVRRSYAEKLAWTGMKLANAVHPSAVISETAVLGLHSITRWRGLLRDSRIRFRDRAPLLTARAVQI